MKRGPNEAGLAIEVRTACGFALCGRRPGAPNPLVGDAIRSGGHMDAWSVRAVRPGGAVSARGYSRRGLRRHDHCRQPPIFHCDLPLSAVANGSSTGGCPVRTHNHLHTAGPEPKREARHSGEAAWPVRLPGSGQPGGGSNGVQRVCSVLAHQHTLVHARNPGADALVCRGAGGAGRGGCGYCLLRGGPGAGR